MKKALFLLTVLLNQTASAQEPITISITDPMVSQGQTLLAQGAVDLTFSVSSTNVKKVRVIVIGAVDAATVDVDIDPYKREHLVSINLFKGLNNVSLIGFVQDQPDPNVQASISVTCNGRKCGTSKTLIQATSKSSETSEDPKEDSAKITIKQPHKGDRVKNVTFVDSRILIQKKSGIERLLLTVLNDDKPVKQDQEAFELERDAEKELNPRIRIGKGKNVITAFNAAKPSEFASVELVCDGEECGKAEDGIGKTPYTRAILGFDQSAAASASPVQKLFLEFNLSAPLFKKGNGPLEAPVWLWLNPRITTLPQQISTSVGEFATSANFFNPILSGKVNEIVQAFEFLGGVEIPIKLNGSRVTSPIASGLWFRQAGSFWVIADRRRRCDYTVQSTADRAGI